MKKIKHHRPTIDELISNILADETMMQYYKHQFETVHPSSAEAIEYNKYYWQRAYSANTLRMLIGEPIATYNNIYEGGLNDLYLKNPSTISALPIIGT